MSDEYKLLTEQPNHTIITVLRNTPSVARQTQMLDQSESTPTHFRSDTTAVLLLQARYTPTHHYLLQLTQMQPDPDTVSSDWLQPRNETLGMCVYIHIHTY